MKGKLRYIPREMDDFIENLKKEEQIPNLADAMRRTKDYAILGKETRRLAKKFGWSFGLK